jgi:hypothetical protein
MFENSLFGRFSPPDNTGKLVNQYRKLRPDDAAAKYVKVILLWLTVSPFQDYSPYAYTLCRRVRCGLLYQDYNSSEMHPALFPVDAM